MHGRATGAPSAREATAGPRERNYFQLKRFARALTATATLAAGCATWRPIDERGDRDLREGVFVVLEDRALFVAVESVDRDAVHGQVRGGCLADGRPLERAELFPSDSPERTCERLGWDTPSELGQPVSIPLARVVEARVYDPRTLQSAALGASAVLLVLVLSVGVAVGVVASTSTRLVLE